MFSRFLAFSGAGGLQFCPSRPWLQAVPSFLFTVVSWVSWWGILADTMARCPPASPLAVFAVFTVLGCIFLLPAVVLVAELLYCLLYFPRRERERAVRDVMES